MLWGLYDGFQSGQHPIQPKTGQGEPLGRLGRMSS